MTIRVRERQYRADEDGPWDDAIDEVEPLNDSLPAHAWTKPSRYSNDRPAKAFYRERVVEYVRLSALEAGPAALAKAEEAWRAIPPHEMVIHCPACGKQHLDIGEFATRVHRKHLCENTTEGPGTGCGHLWVPFPYATKGVGQTAEQALESERAAHEMARADLADEMDDSAAVLTRLHAVAAQLEAAEKVVAWVKARGIDYEGMSVLLAEYDAAIATPPAQPALREATGGETAAEELASRFEPTSDPVTGERIYKLVREDTGGKTKACPECKGLPAGRAQECIACGGTCRVPIVDAGEGGGRPT
jgi:hypothetical protein